VSGGVAVQRKWKKKAVVDLVASEVRHET